MLKIRNAIIFTLALGVFLTSGNHVNAIAQVVDATHLDGKVVIPWGSWLGAVAALIGSCSAAFVAAIFRELPAQWSATAKAARVDQLLEKAIAYGCNTVEGASRDKSMEVPVANDVIEQALEYALKHGPAAILNWAGGEEALRQKIVARLDVVAAGAVSP